MVVKDNPNNQGNRQSNQREESKQRSHKSNSNQAQQRFGNNIQKPGQNNPNFKNQRVQDIDEKQEDSNSFKTDSSLGDDESPRQIQIQKSMQEDSRIQNKSVNVSGRQRKEQKKLQKYDSNSIDEEEFQDYFSNPQKRKEFDRQRLQQQMREIQNIAGFTLGQFGNKSLKSMKDALPVYPGADIDINTESNQQKNYATVSLCCLSVTNPFRNKIIQLVAINPWFDRVILVVILLNCLFLAVDGEVVSIEKYSDDIDFVFLIVYTIEMLLKIIAMGFVMRAHSYLRDTWNILDFLVVILGWLSKLLDQSNISAIRVIRILRPLRTINSMPGMSSLVSTILNSLPEMFNIMMLFIFMLIMFGTIATQLFGGILGKRCQTKHHVTSEPTFEIGKQKQMIFCLEDADCIRKQPELFPEVTSTLQCVSHENPIGGSFSFDNILLSIMNIFQIITLEGWTDMMYIVRDATESYFSDVFFVICVLFGAFFVLNLMIAVQFTYLGDAFDTEDRRQIELKEKLTQKKKMKLESEMDDSFFDESDEDDQNQDENQSKKGKKKKGCLKQFHQKYPSCVAWSNNVEEFVEQEWFNKLIISIIIINTGFLASEHYEMPNAMKQASDYANFVFTSIFFIEMVLKLYGLGVKKYVAEGFNVFDGIVVMVSLIELFQEAENSGLSVLRAFRLLRIFKIIKSWTSLRMLLSTVLSSLSAITNLGFLTCLFLFIFALLAKQFYNEQLQTLDGDDSRYDFQNTASALVTVFIVLTGENWNAIMVEVMKKFNSMTSPAIFFMLIIVIGNYMLLNLFLAILLKFISENDEDNDDVEGKGNEIKKQITSQEGEEKEPDGSDNDSIALNSSNSNLEEEFEQIKRQLQELSKMNMTQQRVLKGSEKDFEGGDDEEKSFQDQQDLPSPKQKNKVPTLTTVQIQKYAAKLNNQGKSQKKKSIEINEGSRSLYIFGHDNWLRLKFKLIIENSYFDGFIYHLIAFNSLLLMLDEPILTDEYQKNSISLMLNIISILFVVECVMKIIVMGFVIGPKTYLRDAWNILDFIIVFFSIFNWVLDALKFGDISFVKGFRALRALRPLRVVSKNEGIKTVVNSLLKSIPSLLNVLLIIILFLLVFGILGVQIFKGAVSSCNDTDMTIQNKTACLSQATYTVNTYDEWQEVNGTEQTAREWIAPFSNYNNIINSMLTFFEICSLEMWPDRMFAAVDAVGYDLVPQTKYNEAISLLFIIFIFLTTFFIMNMFVSVIVDKFNEEIKKRQGAHNFTEEQKEWVKIQRLLVHTNPKIIPVEPINCFRLQCFKVVQSQVFEYFIMAAIVVNTVFLCIDYYGKSEKLTRILELANLIFVVIFSIEMVLKITALGFTYYWHVNWNKFDCIIVIMSLIAIDGRLLESVGFNVTALRIIRVSRLLRMVKTSQGLRSLLKTLYMSLGNILQTATLLLLMLFTFAIAGMNLFGDIGKPDDETYLHKLYLWTWPEFINQHANFATFFLAMSTLWRACTGESWNGLMHDCSDYIGAIAVIYWIAFQLITFFIFMNVFIAVIYENFNDIQASEDENDILSLKKKDIKAFQHIWAKYNPMGELYMRTIRLPEFLKELPPPLGYQGIRIEESKLNKIIFCLNIRDHEGKVYYPEVMWTIFHSIVGINDDKVNSCDQIANILKIVKRKYKAGLGKKVTLDSLCGNKYFRTELTAIKYIQAMKILTKWKAFKDKQLKLKEQKMINNINNNQNIELDDDEPDDHHHHEEEPTQNEDIRSKRVNGIQRQIEEAKTRGREGGKDKSQSRNINNHEEIELKRFQNSKK